MMHIITSSQFTEYSQERLRSRAPRRVEEPEGVVPPRFADHAETSNQARGFFRSFSLEGLRRLFGSTPEVRHS
ncbi:MAG: hypothetical protein QM753_00480 [Thermomicrobiales bacterium]